MTLKTITAAGLLALAALAATTPANAGSASVTIGSAGVEIVSHRSLERYHWGGERRDLLSPRQVRRVLRGQGYRAIDYLDRRGRIYEARATDHRGRRVGLVVSARSGAVLNRYRL